MQPVRPPLFQRPYLSAAVSGVEPFAWGELTLSELSELYRVHQRAGAAAPQWRAPAGIVAGSPVASTDCKTTNCDRPGERPSDDMPLTLALFAHDFNLLFWRQLLRLHWVVDSYDAPTSVAPDPDGGWRVVGFFTAATFRDLVLAAVDPRCVLQPLRDTTARLRDRAPPPSSPLDSTPAVLAAAVVGFACSLCGVLMGTYGFRVVKLKHEEVVLFNLGAEHTLVRRRPGRESPRESPVPSRQWPVECDPFKR
ncbi:hypothetical protein EMIHUDRAFT_204024 [Emiliania huxleyi CCMP1516]|uniref:Uncharacterized protein n=2 Tax=Emiliania huxleyi TaxID=2903 RepID=A0A0D3K0U1_EMIH1|nr:hypothetical protein EMIHUDRAFT_204024 [Emiliania huxleyi CCMP1516]EOD29376.1 hypothetical protein EMIHUDRAFT_204024 [Emiliania huxleyi CCMP1516]|eukprot:XP_005781805.1 hypothetical protein EMIHUDRAFT_204024 [Emiliania huxleyi CCMP1516]